MEWRIKDSRKHVQCGMLYAVQGTAAIEDNLPADYVLYRVKGKEGKGKDYILFKTIL